MNQQFQGLILIRLKRLDLTSDHQQNQTEKLTKISQKMINKAKRENAKNEKRPEKMV